MLPNRSKRIVDSDGEVPRLQLASPWQLALIAVLMIGLFAMIFPRKQLIEKLYENETLDSLTLSYINNLYRTEPGNADLAILLARAQGDELSLEQTQQLVGHIVGDGDPRQRGEARLLLLSAYLRSAEHDAKGAAIWLDRASVLLDDSANETLPPRLTSAFAAAAFRLGNEKLGRAFLAKLNARSPNKDIARYADEALGEGRYQLAAALYLLAADLTPEREQARQWFQDGINALMAQSRFQAAMQAARQHLGNLRDDAPTLRYLIRISLAAGDPLAAARYAQDLIFAPPTPATPANQGRP